MLVNLPWALTHTFLFQAHESASSAHMSVRLPQALTHTFLFQARESASGANRWLLVNVQNVKEFACQVLNRDVWSNPRIKALIKESFVLFQVIISCTNLSFTTTVNRPRNNAIPPVLYCQSMLRNGKICY